jgi:hypothetical protein
MTKHEVLQQVSFGSTIAEDEPEELNSYFVETDQWRRIYAGEVDVLYGPKGSGKSAIYSLLSSRSNELFDRQVIVVSAENPQGAPASAVARGECTHNPFTSARDAGPRPYFLTMLR